MAEIMIKPGETAMVNGKPVTNTGCSPMWIGEEDPEMTIAEWNERCDPIVPGSVSDYLPAEGAHFLAKNMTKREYFAGLAMSGLLADNSSIYENDIAKEAVEYADALLKELEK